jgi:hypothetical protein
MDALRSEEGHEAIEKTMVESRFLKREFGRIEGRLARAAAMMRSNVEGKCALNVFYFHSECTSFNTALREAVCEADWEDALKWYVYHTDYALFVMLKPPSRHECFRGMNAANLPEEGKQYWFNLKIGRCISDKAYWCTSESKDVAMGFAFGNNDPGNAVPLLFHITHTSGRSIKKYVSERFRDEKEVVFPRNTIFKIEHRWVSHEMNKGHQRICHNFEITQVGEPQY